MSTTRVPLERVHAAREELMTTRRRFLGTAAASALVAGGLHLPTTQSVEAQEFSAATSKVFSFGRQINFADLAPSNFYNNSFINVTGLRGTVVGVRVRLVGLQHQNVGDLNVLLVAPNGNAVMLMSDVGDGTNVDNLNLSFSETATIPLPGAGPIAAGDYAATNLVVSVPSDQMPPNAPLPNVAAISDLTGVPWPEAIGPWHLFTYDKRVTAGGRLRNWTLEILTTNREPIARRDVYTVEQGDRLKVNRRDGLLDNDRDHDGDRLKVIPFRDNSRLGRIEVKQNGSFTFQARPNRSGRVNFRYSVTDGEVVSTSRVTIRVVERDRRKPRDRRDREDRRGKRDRRNR